MSQCSCGAPPVSNQRVDIPKPSNIIGDLNKNNIDKVFAGSPNLKPIQNQRMKYNHRIKRNKEYLVFLFILLIIFLFIIYEH